MRKNLSTDLVDDYEASQLNPVYQGTEEGEATHRQITEQLDKMSEVASMRIRMATFEAIVDELIEDAVDASEETPREAEITEAIAPVVDKAVAMYLVPATIRKRIPTLIAKHLRRRDERKRLLAKVAHFVMEAQTEVDETIAEKISLPIVEDATCPEENRPEEVPAQESLSIRQMYNRYMAGEISETQLNEAVEQSQAITDAAVNAEEETKREATPVVEVCDVEVCEGLTDQQAASLRYLAASALNHRSATVAVSQSLTGPMLSNMLHKLRNVLPAEFLKKFQVK